MGWWSTDILGGDGPLDFEDEFFEIAKVDKFPESGEIADIPKETVEKCINEFVTVIEKDTYEPWIGWQVLAVTVMKVGAKVTDSIKNKMIEACDADEWAQEDSDRKRACDGLKKALQQYDGTPIIIKSKGLFEVIFKHIEDGKDGLVNKNIK